MVTNQNHSRMVGKLATLFASSMAKNFTVSSISVLLLVHSDR